MGDSDSEVFDLPKQVQQLESTVTDEEISEMVISCSACDERFSFSKLLRFKKHIHLSVLVCKKCFDFYDDGNFMRDETGDQYCRWCADGGRLIACDSCTNAFCVKCIRRNMGRKALSGITGKDKWNCFVCDPSPLEPHVKFCKRILKFVRNEMKKKVESLAVDLGNSDSDSSLQEEWKTNSWAGPLLVQADNAVVVLNRRMARVKRKLSRNSNKVNDCVTKLKKLLSKHHQFIEYLLVDIKNGLEENAVDVQPEADVNVNGASGSAPASPKSSDHPNNTLKKKSEGKPRQTESPLPSDDVLQDRDEANKEEHEPSASSEPCPEVESSELGTKEINDNEQSGDEVLAPNSDDELEESVLPDVTNDSDNEVSDSINETQDLNTTENISVNEEESLQQGADDITPAIAPVESENGNSNFPEDETRIQHEKVSKSHSNSTDDNTVETTKPSKKKTLRKGDPNHVDDVNLSSDNKSVQQHSGSDNDAAALQLEFSSSESEDASSKNVKSAVGHFLKQTAPSEQRKSTRLKSSKGKTGSELDELDGDRNETKEAVKIKTEDVGSDEENEKARRSLLDELSTPQKARKRKRSLSSVSSASDEDSNECGDTEKDRIYPEMENDEKLKLRCVVVLEKLDLPNVKAMESFPVKEKDRKTKRKCIENTTEKTLDDLISSLSAVPKRKPKNAAKPANTYSDSSDSSNEFENTKLKSKTTPKKKIKSAIIVSSDSSDENMDTKSSSESKLAPKKEVKDETKSVNTLAKDALLIDSSMSSDSDVKIESKKPAKSASKPSSASRLLSDSDSSSSDFVNRKKYAKCEKLLKVSLGSRNKDGRSRKCKEKDGAETSKKSGKKSRMRKVISDSEKSKSSSSSSTSSSDSESSDAKPTVKSKKRKRIKAVSNSDSDVKEIADGSTPKGRKNIRKLLRDQELGKETKMASVAEKERRDRVKARQKLYNQVTEEGGDFGEAVTRKLVLETNPKTKEELVEVPPELICKLKPHQVNGVKFMWECLIESLSRLESKNEHGSGCVLAHCMGLGKTLQVIAFISTLLNNERVNAKIKTALICCPLNTIRNWSKEFDMWLGSTENEVQVFELVDVKHPRDRADVLEHWLDSGGVMIMSYEQFRQLMTGRKISKKCRTSFEKTLVNPGPDIVVCDEGHVLKNESSALSKAMSKIQTRRRIVLTGTPLQNNLDEYHCMIQFVKPMLLGTKKEFQNRFVNPIKNGQCADSNQSDVKLMKKRVHILHKLLEGCVQRCDYNHVTKYLPPKYEFVISVRLSEIQIRLYRMYLNRFSRNGAGSGEDDDDKDKPKKVSGSSLFKDFSMLKLIWTHPFLLAMQKKKADLKALLEDNSMEEFINDGSDSSSDSDKKDDTKEVICLSDDAKAGPSKGPSKQKKKNKSDDSDVEEVVANWKTRSRGNPDQQSESEDEGPQNNEWWNELITEEELPSINLSGKMLLLFEILKQCELVGDKLLLFTQSLLTLDLIEELLQRQDEKHQTLSELETVDMIGTWVNGVDYFRMDGSTSADIRKRYIDVFNDPLNERARLFMISTKAGSLGTNLVGANRVIIMDASWNPTHDVQAIFRVFRFGQKKPAYVYRFLAQGSMEEKIYDRQVTKQSMAFRVVDEQQIERHFNAADLEALYSFEPDSKTNRPTPMVPKDRLLAELLIKEETRDWIVTYHEHDSLLENKSEEGLTEDEKKLAWAEYEAQKEGLITDGVYVNAETEFLMEILDEDTTSDLNQIVGKMKLKRPTLITLQILRFVYSLDSICDTKCKELIIVSQNLKKNNEELPKDMQAKIAQYQKLIADVRALKVQNEMRQEQMNKQQQLKQQQEYQHRLLQQRIAQQQQRYNLQPPFQGAVPRAANPAYLGRMSAPRRPTVIHSSNNINVNQPNGHAMGSAQNFAFKTYGRQVSNNITVTRGPIITEAVDDRPASGTGASANSGPIITEIID